MSNAWKLAKLDWRQFIPDHVSNESISEFLRDRNLAFLESSGKSSQSSQSKSGTGASDYLTSFESHLMDLTQKATTKSTVPEIFDMIQRDLRDHIDTPEFIALLTRVVCKSCVVKGNPMTFNETLFTERKNILERYINKDQTKMFHCLLSVQFLVTDLQHPPGEHINGSHSPTAYRFSLACSNQGAKCSLT